MSISTPCRAACQNHGGICLGCQRTIEEIITWKDKTEAQRLEIMAQINPQRQTQANPDGQSTHQTTHQTTTYQTTMNQTHCAQCQQPMQCDISAGQTHCWCFELERREIPESLRAQNACLCRHCLSKLPLAD